VGAWSETAGQGLSPLPNAECRVPGRPCPQPPALGLYVHFPFCSSKCAYCDFASFPLQCMGGLSAARRYLDAVGVELDLRAASGEFYGAAVDTIYFGGGTPTALPAEWLTEMLARIGRRFAVAAEAEVTVEANPGTVDGETLETLRGAGVNRLSLGVQSFRDQELQLLGRVHTAAEAAQAAEQARAAGFGNLSLDLISGLPGQTVAQWRESVAQAVALAPEHISAYGLSLEEGTPLAEAVASGQLPAPDEDQGAEMYRLTEEALSQAGYEHYEISNYARPGRPCRHNRRYWAGDEYLGLGSSAHSHRRGTRWNNLRAPAVYVGWLERGLLPTARAEALSARERVGELLMLGLRCAEGVSEEEVAARTGLAPQEVFGDQIRRLCERGLLVRCDGRLQMPRRWWLVSNEVLCEFAR
jgi:oxygen-independent coproporphyrinogen-3 oxidase